MEDVISAWLRLTVTAAPAFRSYPLTPTYASTDFRRQSIYHPSQPGRWYVTEHRLDGPAHHTREQWEGAIQGALAEYAAEVDRRPLPQTEPVRRKRRKDWWLDDFAGKHGPGT